MHTNDFRLSDLKQLVKSIQNDNTQILIVSQLIFNNIIAEFLESCPIRNLSGHDTIDSVMTIFLTNIQSNIAIIANQLFTDFLDDGGLTDTTLTNQTNVISERINTNLTLFTKFSCHYVLPP